MRKSRVLRIVENVGLAILCIAGLSFSSLAANRYEADITPIDVPNVPGNVMSVSLSFFDAQNNYIDQVSGTVLNTLEGYIPAPATIPSYDHAQINVVVYSQALLGQSYYSMQLENKSFSVDESTFNSYSTINFSPVSIPTVFYDAYTCSLSTDYINLDPSNNASLVFWFSGITNEDGHHLSSSDFPLTFDILGRFSPYQGFVYSGSGSGSGSGSDGVGSPNWYSANTDTLNSVSDKTDTIIQDQAAGFQGLTSQLTTMSNQLGTSLEWMAYNLSALENGLTPGDTWTDSEGDDHEYATYNQLSFALVNEHVQITSTPAAGTFLGILSRKFDELFEYFKFQFEIFFQWFYPLKDSTPQYWLVYNTDNNTGEWVNPATVTYYITWYLGQLYSQNFSNDTLDDLQDTVDEAATRIAAFEQQQHAVVDSVSSSLSSFAPDLNTIGSFRALAWCSNFLQQVYLALGMYGTVITVGLLLAVCMQFIGYFKFKV